MKALVKVVAGDTANVAAVAAVTLTGVLLARLGHAREAALLLPVLVMAAVAWLAAR